MRTPRIRVQRRALHGVLLLDKPLHQSSHDALQKVKWLLRAEKAGHTGTLDPLASGVLPICLGAATKFSHIHLEADKTYEATLRLGIKTSTGDAEGEIIYQCDVAPEMTSQPLLDKALQAFSGRISQVPPMTSALKKDGQPLYKLARQGIEVERQARDVVIHALELVKVDDLTLGLTVRCSKGTYIRTLGESIGEMLGCAGHLTMLRRLATGNFSVQDAISLDQLESLTEREREARLLPLEALLLDYLRVDLDLNDAGRFLSGVRRKTDLPDHPLVKVYAPDHQLLGTAHIKAGELIPTRLLSPIEIEQMQHLYPLF